VFTALLLFCGILTVHQFTVTKNVFSIILTVAGMAFIVFLVLLLPSSSISCSAMWRVFSPKFSLGCDDMRTNRIYRALAVLLAALTLLTFAGCGSDSLLFPGTARGTGAGMGDW